MNKPLRDHLLARHAAAAPRLDALRLAALPPADVTWREFLRELFRPHRSAWRFLAFTWVALLAFQLLVAGPARPPAYAGPAPSPEALAACFAQFNFNETLSPIAQVP
jgi:hypothetical protein